MSRTHAETAGCPPPWASPFFSTYFLFVKVFLRSPLTNIQRFFCSPFKKWCCAIHPFQSLNSRLLNTFKKPPETPERTNVNLSVFFVAPSNFRLIEPEVFRATPLRSEAKCHQKFVSPLSFKGTTQACIPSRASPSFLAFFRKIKSAAA